MKSPLKEKASKKADKENTPVKKLPGWFQKQVRGNYDV